MSADLLEMNSLMEARLGEKTEEGGFVTMEGESYYRITDTNELPPFLMTVVSGSDHWMFIASNGALTAGRRNADNALFPYCTQDKLFELAHTVGGLSLFWIECGDGARLWEPFASGSSQGAVSRNLYKNTDGSRVVFEEVHNDLALRFRYTWTTSDGFGFARKGELFNLGGEARKIRMLDGIQNLVPYGLDQAFVGQFSNLSDAYKKNELLESEGLGVYYLSSIPTDRAEPSEGLKGTVAWSLGLAEKTVLVSSRQVDAFRKGSVVEAENETRGLRCSYLVQADLTLEAGGEKTWWIVAEINQDASQIEALRQRLGNADIMQADLLGDIEANAVSLRKKIADSDGLQLTGEPLRDARHRSNTMFNIMRGGIFDSGYVLSIADLKGYLASWNKDTLRRYCSDLDALGKTIDRNDLIEWAGAKEDVTLLRLVNEYLPLTFSRRHGDPSRPWNKFSIETRDEAGKPVLSYQGNWRDIFQNWEPLAYSYPGFLTGMISRFLNSSTADGYNPYRVTRDGFDWEILDPEEPWSNIGYWGDHQIVYLLKLLEALEKHSPETLEELLGQESFVYAHVPYRIRGFAEIWNNPRETVDYDEAASEALAAKAKELGADGKLLRDRSGEVVSANMWEKLLAPLLAKLSNFVQGGGIWMNTQRPEWNDANNALVGYGVSVVTLCYVNRYLAFLQGLVARADLADSIEVDNKLADFLEDQLEIFEESEAKIEGALSGAQRFGILKRLGEGGEAFREAVYEGGMGEARRKLPLSVLKKYIEVASLFVGRSIDANRREDGMYHSYNLLSQGDAFEFEIGRLPEMLEGQVAVLSSNRLSTGQVLELLESLRQSRLYREDVDSFILYPDRELPRFLEKNRIDEERVYESALLSRMLEVGDARVLKQDASGMYRFNGDFKNSGDLEPVLEQVKSDYADVCSDTEMDATLELFEDTFDHRRFTGRSGTFFAYEGLGSVYWHMVSKLVLAIQENCLKASDVDTREGLTKAYFATLKGLGFESSPRAYGAFPIDAYSHTPKHAGAQQPGMTGQVKEDILSRWGELGVCVDGGQLRFDPKLLMPEAFLQKADTFEYWSLSGEKREVGLAEDSLAFTYCQTLVEYALGEEGHLAIHYGDGRVVERAETTLTAEESASLFGRSGEIASIHVTVAETSLLSTH